MAERKIKAPEGSTAASGAETTSKVDENKDPEPSSTAVTPAAAPTAAPKAPAVPEQELPAVMPSNAVSPLAPYNDNTTRLLDVDGNELVVKDCLVYPGEDDPGILVTVVKRMYREFTLPGSRTKTTQLIHPEGARITKADAAILRAEMERQATD